MSAGMKRTQAEILERHSQADNFLGFARDALAEALDAEHLAAAGYAPGEGWKEPTGESVEQTARGYLIFAIGKIEDHRGISAERSTIKLREYAWLLGRDDVVEAMSEADYPQYGAPMVKAFAEGMGWDWPADVELNRMAEGLPCEDGCESGCGS